MKRFCIVPVLILLFAYCQPQTDSHSHRKYLDKFNDELNLQYLRNCEDSFELRFRTEIPLLKYHYGQVLVIKKNKTSWKCLEYNYLFHTAPWGSADEEYFNQYGIDTIWIYKKQPKSGWDKFFKKIESENIYGLPGREAIKNSLDSLHVTLADGILYEVDFVNGQQYRNYAFNSPQEFVNEIPACRSMTNIIEIFDEEFGVADDSDKIIIRLPENVILLYDTALQRLIKETKDNYYSLDQSQSLR